MAKVALCWELGGGSSHLAILSEYISPLKDQGHEVCLITQSIATANGIDEFLGIPVYQAPTPQMSLQHHDVVNYSSLLLLCGYDNPSYLAAMLQAWVNLFEAIDIDFLIVEHSPSAVLAAAISDIPHAMTGQGFMVPPLSYPMPSMVPWKSIEQSRLIDADALLIKNINHAVQIVNSDHAEFDSVSSIFSKADKWVTSFPELDHYGSRDEPYYARSKTLYLGVEPSWPKVSGEKIFVYFDAKSPHLNNLLKQLVKIKQPVLAVIPGLSAKLVAQFDNTNVQIQAELVNVKKVAEQCKLVITHAGHCTVADFLLMGIPCLLLPSTVERTMLAYRLGASRLGFAGSPDSSQIDIAAMLKALKSVDKIWENAQEFAENYKGNRHLKSLEKVVGNILI